MIENAKIGARSQNKIDLTKFLLTGITVKCQVPKNSLARGFFSHELIELNDATQIVLLLKFFFFLFGLGVHSIMSLWDKFLSANKSSSSKKSTSPQESPDPHKQLPAEESTPSPPVTRSRAAKNKRADSDTPKKRLNIYYSPVDPENDSPESERLLSSPSLQETQSSQPSLQLDSLDGSNSVEELNTFINSLLTTKTRRNILL